MNINYDRILAYAAEYGIPVLQALAILVIGWLIAKVAASLTKKLLDRTEFDNKLAAKITGGRAKSLEIEKGVSKFVYWLILLFVIVAALQVLNLDTVTVPLNALLTKITAFIPNILAAAALGLVAWAIATILRTVVTNLLSSFQVDDKLSESTGEEKGKLSLAKTLGDAVYYLIFLLFLPQILDALNMDGLRSVEVMVGDILGFLPLVFAAIIIFFIFYLVARIVQRLATNLLASIGFDAVPEKLGFTSTPRPEAPGASKIVGYVVFAVILFLGAVQAFNTLNLDTVSGLANELLAGLFNILVAGVIFAFGLFLGNLAHKAIVASGRKQAETLAFVARAAILIFTGAMALYRTDLAPEIVNLAFGALIVGLAAAAALAFGLGGRDAAAETIAKWRADKGD